MSNSRHWEIPLLILLYYLMKQFFWVAWVLAFEGYTLVQVYETWLLLQILPLLHWEQWNFFYLFVCLFLCWISPMEIRKLKIIHITVYTTSLLSWPMKLPVVYTNKNNLRTGNVLLTHTYYWEEIICKL